MQDTKRKTYEKPVLVKAGELSKSTAVDHFSLPKNAASIG